MNLNNENKFLKYILFINIIIFSDIINNVFYI